MRISAKIAEMDAQNEATQTSVAFFRAMTAEKWVCLSEFYFKFPLFKYLHGQFNLKNKEGREKKTSIL